MSKAEDTRAQLLEAANQVVLRKGAANLTLAAVAREAGVSKGGLLYHFPSKDALIEAMIEHLMEESEHFMSQTRGSDPDETGRWLRAYIHSGFDAEGAQLERSAAILAAVAANRELLRPMKQRYKQWQQAAEQDGMDPSLATLIRLAVDGLWFNELLRLSPLSEDLRIQVFEALIRLTRPT